MPYIIAVQPDDLRVVTTYDINRENIPRKTMNGNEPPQII